MKMKTLKIHRSDRFEEIPFFKRSSQIFWRCGNFVTFEATAKHENSSLASLFLHPAPRPKPLHRRGPEIAWMRPNGKMSNIEAASWRCALTKRWSHRKRLNSMTWGSQAPPRWIVIEFWQSFIHGKQCSCSDFSYLLCRPWCNRMTARNQDLILTMMQWWSKLGLMVISLLKLFLGGWFNFTVVFLIKKACQYGDYSCYANYAYELL